MKKHQKRIIPAVLLVLLLVASMVMFSGCTAGQNAPAPTAEPTAVATEVPTEAPTAEPTAEPTEEPAPEATAEPAAEETSAEAPAEEAAATTADDVMVTVNGQGVTRADVDACFNNMLSYYSQYGYDTSDPSFLTFLQQYALEYAVQLEVMEQKATELGLDQYTDEEKAQIEADSLAEWNSLVDSYVSYYGGVTSESTEEEVAAARVNMLAMLESMGYTEAAWLETAYDNEKFNRVEAHMIQGATVTDEEIKALFDQYVAQDEESYKDNVAMYEYMTQYYGETTYYTPEGYRGVTHILLEVDETLLGNYQDLAARLEEQQEAEENPEAVEAEATATDVEAAAEPTATPEPPVTQEEVDAARQAILDSVQPTIDEINKKLAEGAAFADLIVEYGTDPGMEQEPNKSQGYSVHMDSIVWDPVFVQAAFSVNNVGDIAEPVVGSYGVHIVQYTRDVPAGPVEFTADIELALHEEALSNKEGEQFNATMEAWLQEAELVYSEEAQALMSTGAEEEAAAEETTAAE